MVEDGVSDHVVNISKNVKVEAEADGIAA